MKKITATALILLMLLTMTACDGDKSQKTAKPSDEVSVPETETENNSNQQTTKPVDQDSNLENNEPPQQITINGNVLTYQSTYCSDGLPQYPYEQNTDAGYQIDLYIDEEQGEYEICRCGKPIKYRDKTPYVGTEFSMTKEEFLEILMPKLKGFFGTSIDQMEITTYYPEKIEGWQPTDDFLIVFKRRAGEDNYLNINYLRLYAGLDGSIRSFTYHYHSHEVEALTEEELGAIKKSDVDAYVQEILKTDPKNVYQHITNFDVEAIHRVVYKDGKLTLKTIIQGASIGAEEYYRDLSEFD